MNVSTGKQFERGKALLDAGQFARAAAEFRELQKSLPNSPLVYNLLGFCYLKQGLEKQAVLYFKKAVALNPDFGPAHNNLGGLYLASGRPKEAIGEFSAVIRIDPRDSQAYSNLAQAELAADQPEAAIRHLRQSGNPKAAEILYAWAAESFKRQRYKTTSALLKGIAPEMRESAAWHALLGESYYKLGDSGPAATELQKAMELDPRNEDYVLELGEVFVLNNSKAAAATLFETGTKVFPNSARMWYGLGVAYLAEVHLADAEAALRKSLELDPTLDLAYVVLAQACVDGGEWDRLQGTARRLIELNPRNPMGYYYQAVALERSAAPLNGTAASDTARPPASENDQDIERLLRKSVDLDDSDPQPRYELAKLLAREGHKEAARQELEKIVRRHPDFGPAHYQLVRFYREQGKVEKGEEEHKMFDQISAKERERAMTRMLVEVHERRPSQ